MDGSAQNFQGPLYSLQVFFGRVTCPPGVLGQRGRVAPFQNRNNKANKMLGAEFEIWPTAGENGAGKWGWPGCGPNFGISTFCPMGPMVPRGPGRGENQKSKLGPPRNQIQRTFCFIQFFDSTHP